MSRKFFSVITAVIFITTYHFPLCSAVVDNYPSVTLTEINFSDLVILDPSTSLLAANALATLGAVQIVGIPNYLPSRQDGLENLSDCLSKDKNAPTIIMKDGSFRSTAGAETISGVAQPMSSSCGDSASKLRAAVNTGTRQLFLALDNLSQSTRPNGVAPTPVLDQYISFDDIITKGDHLEHLHAFRGTGNEKKDISTQTLEMHTDSGLFIAMTTGFFTGNQPTESSGLYVTTPVGSIAKIVARDDAVIIMVGESGARWLQPVLGTPLRATPHALIAGLSLGAARSWYGKMFQPPPDAIVDPASKLTYKDYRKLQIKAIKDPLSLEEGSFLPLACGPAIRIDSSAGSSVPWGAASMGANDEGGCTGDEIYCWMRCMSTADLPCGTNAVCSNPAGVVTDPNAMCPTCEPTCPSLGNTSFNGYCMGKGVSMYMDGFKSSAQSTNDDPVECVNLLFISWTLDSPVKLAIAWLGVFELGLLVQFMTKYRARLSKKQGTWTVRAAVAAMYSIQLVFSYFLMLVAMTYNIELFCAVCAGLSVGYCAWLLDMPAPLTLDPCCSAENDVHQDDVKTKLLSSSTHSGSVGVVRPTAVASSSVIEEGHGGISSSAPVVARPQSSCCGNYVEDD